MISFGILSSLFLLIISALTCLAADLPILFFYGTVLDDRGDAVPEARVQFWHTDYHGNYDHPANPYNGYDLVSDFQYYGAYIALDCGAITCFVVDTSNNSPSFIFLLAKQARLRQIPKENSNLQRSDRASTHRDRSRTSPTKFS